MVNVIFQKSKLNVHFLCLTFQQSIFKKKILSRLQKVDFLGFHPSKSFEFTEYFSENYF